MVQTNARQKTLCKPLNAVRELLPQSPGTRMFVTGRPNIPPEPKRRLAKMVTSLSISSKRGDIIRYLRVESVRLCHAQPTGHAHSLSRYRSHNNLGHALWIDTSAGRKVEIVDVGRHLRNPCSLRYRPDKLSDMRFETGVAPEGYRRESRMHGGYGA